MKPNELHELIASAIAAIAIAACASQKTLTVQEYHINNAAQKCNGKTACADVQPDGCMIFVNAKQATERDYGAAVRKCWEGRV